MSARFILPCCCVELVPVGNGWMENSRGFILPPVWDPRSLMTGATFRANGRHTADLCTADSCNLSAIIYLNWMCVLMMVLGIMAYHGIVWTVPTGQLRRQAARHEKLCRSWRFTRQFARTKYSAQSSDGLIIEISSINTEQCWLNWFGNALYKYVSIASGGIVLMSHIAPCSKVSGPTSGGDIRNGWRTRPGSRDQALRMQDWGGGVKDVKGKQRDADFFIFIYNLIQLNTTSSKEVYLENFRVTDDCHGQHSHHHVNHIIIIIIITIIIIMIIMGTRVFRLENTLGREPCVFG